MTTHARELKGHPPLSLKDPKNAAVLAGILRSTMPDNECTPEEWGDAIDTLIRECNAAVADCQGASKAQPVTWCTEMTGGQLCYANMRAYCYGVEVFNTTIYCVIPN